MKIKYLIILLASTAIPIFTLAENNGATVHKKTAVQIGDETFDVRYVEYTPPLLFRMIKPEKGPQPEWAKTEGMIKEFYKYEYSLVMNRSSVRLGSLAPLFSYPLRGCRL